MKTTLHKFTFFLIFTLFLTNFVSAQTEDKNGLELYKQGNYKEAIEVFKNKEDVLSLYYLGLSLEQINEKEQAGAVFEKALISSYDSFMTKLRARLNPENKEKKENFSIFFKSLENEVKVGLTSANKAIDHKSKMSKANEWRMKVNSLFEFSQLFNNKETLYSTDEVDKDVNILNKPRPHYTHSAADNGIQGTVILFLVFDKDGKTISAARAEHLPNGLTEESIKAAKKIKFKTAVKNGEPVSIVKFTQFTFSIGR